MKGLKRITIEELRESYVVVYTQEEVELLEKLGVLAIITYVNGGICIGPMANSVDDVIISPLSYPRELIETQEGFVQLLLNKKLPVIIPGIY